MSQPLVAVGSFSMLGGMAALGSGIFSGTSLWPGVALFCLSGLLACVAACIEAAAESAKHEAELDRASDMDGLRAALTATNDLAKELEAKVDHLQKKDALNALG